jgi:hypothetical protein
MANVIDALLVTFGLDTKDFEKGAGKAEGALDKTNKATVKQTKDLEAMGKKGADALNKLKNEALTLTAILLGASGMKEWVAGTVKANIQAGNLGKALNMSVNDINAWKRAASAAGGNGDDMEAALSSMNSALEEFKLRGTISGPLAAFAALKINARDAKGEVIGAHEAMLRIANNMQGRTPQDQAHILQTIMGFGSGATPLLSKGAADIQTRIAEMHRLGDTTTDVLNTSKGLNEEWVKFRAAVDGAATSLESRINPSLANLLQVMRRGVEWANGTTPPLSADDRNVAAPAAAAANAPSAPGQDGGPVIRGHHKKKAPKGLKASIMAQGWTEAQANGILANLMHESGMNPAAVGDNGQAYGIAQWHPDRQADFKAWAGKSIVGSSLADQLGFLQYELTKGKEQKAGKALRGANDSASAASIMSMLYERPADAIGQAAARASTAARMPIGARATAGASGAPVDNSIHIENVTLQTGATNAQALSNDLRAKAGRQTTVAQATSGLQQ